MKRYIPVIIQKFAEWNGCEILHDADGDIALVKAGAERPGPRDYRAEETWRDGINNGKAKNWINL